MSNLVGQTISDGRFLIEREIGRGGAGIVFEAVDVLLKRQVAIKTITSQNNSSNKRFEREVKSLASVKSQYVPEIYNWGNTIEGLPFIVMELLSYSTLEETLLDSTSALTSDDICAIAIEITKALSIIHDAGIVHRDLKPSNVMIHFDEVTGWSVKLLDFGLVHLLAPDQGLTGTDTMLGSVGYFSPEHATPQRIDCRSDIFSLGCILFRAAAGRPPFEAENLFASVLLMNSDTPLAIPPAAPQYLRQIIAKCLQADPAKRFQSALEVRQALESKTFTASPEEVSKDKPRSVKLALLIATVVAIAGLCFLVSSLRNKGAEVNFTTDKKTLSQSITDAAASKNLSAQRKLLTKLATTDAFWNHSTPTNREDLRTIAALQFKSGNIESGELAYDFVYKSLLDRNAPPAQWLDTYNAESASYYDSRCLRPRAFDHGEQALALSIAAKVPPFQRRSYFLLAQLHRLRNDFDASLSYFKKAHGISTSLVSPDENFDAEIAIRYAEVLIGTGDQKQACPLLSYAADQLRQALIVGKSPDFNHFTTLGTAVAMQKDSPDKKQLSRQVSLLLTDASSAFPSPDFKAQMKIDAAVLKLNYDKEGAISDLRALQKTLEGKGLWMFFISAVWILADNEGLTVSEFNDAIRKGLQKCRAEDKAPQLFYFTANLRAASLNARSSGHVSDALKFYSSTVEEAKSYIPTDAESEVAKIKTLITAAEYGLVHENTDLAKQAFEQLRTAKIPPALAARFENMTSSLK